MPVKIKYVSIIPYGCSSKSTNSSLSESAEQRAEHMCTLNLQVSVACAADVAATSADRDGAQGFQVMA